MKRLAFVAGATLLTVGLAGCPGGASVSTDYDHNANFSQFKTFSFAHVTTDNPLYERRIRDEVSKDLEAKGLRPAEGNGELVVTAVGSVHNRREYQTFYDDPGFGYYWGGFGDGFGPGYQTTQVVKYPVGTLVIDMYNGSNKHLVFRGVAKRGISGNADNNIAGVNSAIDRIVNAYPAS